MKTYQEIKLDVEECRELASQRDAVDKQNRATTARYKDAMRRWRLAMTEAKGEDLPAEPRQARLREYSPELANFVSSEIAVSKMLTARDERTWFESMERVEERFRPGVARVIWWDYFANRIADDRWSSLDPYTTLPTGKVTDEDLIVGLVATGYTSTMAWKRIADKATDYGDGEDEQEPVAEESI